MAVTDQEGRYKITGLRREAVYGVLIDYRPDADPLSITLGTTTGGKGRVDRRLGYEGRLDHVFVVPPTLNVVIAGADGGAGLANVTVRAKEETAFAKEATLMAKSDTAGKAVLHLPADGYTLYFEPPIGARSLPREAEIAVTGDPREQTTKVTLEAAATSARSWRLKQRRRSRWRASAFFRRQDLATTGGPCTVRWSLRIIQRPTSRAS